MVITRIVCDFLSTVQTAITKIFAYIPVYIAVLVLTVLLLIILIIKNYIQQDSG